MYDLEPYLGFLCLIGFIIYLLFIDQKKKKLVREGHGVETLCKELNPGLAYDLQTSSTNPLGCLVVV